MNAANGIWRTNPDYERGTEINSYYKYLSFREVANLVKCYVKVNN